MNVKHQDPSVSEQYSEVSKTKVAYSSPEMNKVTIQYAILQVQGSGTIDPFNPEQ